MNRPEDLKNSSNIDVEFFQKIINFLFCLLWYEKINMNLRHVAKKIYQIELVWNHVVFLTRLDFFFSTTKSLQSEGGGHKCLLQTLIVTLVDISLCNSYGTLGFYARSERRNLPYKNGLFSFTNPHWASSQEF